MAALLDGYRVVEVAHALTEYGGRLLASLGAEVILVEPSDGSPTRARMPRVPDSGDSPRGGIPFLARNGGKHSVVLDAGDVDELATLVERADVVLDADGSHLHEVLNAPLADVGPAARITATDRLGLGTSSVVGFAASGALASSGWPDRPPCNAPSWLIQDGVGIYAALMAMTSAFARHRHGVRLDHEVAYDEVGPAIATPWTRLMHSCEQEAAGQGIRSARLVPGPYPIFATSDGYVRAITVTPRQWDAFVELLGSPPDLVDGPWADRAFRTENEDAFHLICAPHFAAMTTADAFHKGQALNLTISPVNTLADFLADEHVAARGTFVDVDDPEFGPLRLPRSFAVTDPADLVMPPSPAPGLGEHQALLATIAAEAPRPTAPGPDDVDGFDPLRPLDGLTLLELGVGAVVPEASSHLALLGADVVKVESRKNIDFLRRIHDDPDACPTFNQLNLGVRSLAVEASTDEGQALLARLVTETDAVVENMRWPVVHNWGLDHAACRRLRDDAITVSSQGFGPGPYGSYQSYGPNLNAYVGGASQWAHPDDPYPVGTNVPHPDHTAGKQAFIALLAAVIRRERGGGGALIEAAQIEAPVWHMTDRYLQQSLSAEPVPPLGNRSHDSAPHGVYPCADDAWLALACDTDAQWTALAALLGNSWADHETLATAAGRLARADDLDAAVAAWTAGRTVDEVETELRAAGVPASRMVTGDDMAADADAHATGYFAFADHPAAGGQIYTALPVRLADGRRHPMQPAPCLGEHTDDVLTGLLDLDTATIADLHHRRIVGW